MQQSKTWARIKKTSMVGSCLLISVSACFVSLVHTNGNAINLFEGVFQSFLYLFLFTLTSSFGLFTYIESISKDITELKTNRKKIELALSALSVLKREVIGNASLVTLLLILDFGLRGLSNVEVSSTYFSWYVMSARSGLYTLACFAIVEQILGFSTAIEFREVIQKNKQTESK